MKIPVQDKIAELEQRIAKLEKAIGKSQTIGPTDMSWFAKVCDVFFNGRKA